MHQERLELSRIHICQDGVKDFWLHIPQDQSSTLSFGEVLPDHDLEVGRFLTDDILMHPEQVTLAGDPEICVVGVVGIVVPPFEDFRPWITHF